MRTKIAAISSLLALGCLSTPAFATFTLTGSELAGVGLSAPGTTLGDTNASATYSSGQITLKTGDSVNSFFDTGSITIANGFDGASFGTLSQFLASSASFNLVSFTGNNNGDSGAYWDVTLSDGLTFNTFGINATGANAFASTYGITADSAGTNFFAPWGSPGLSSYMGLTVTAVTIDVGGWGGNGVNTDVINSITLPGTLSLPAATPDGGSTVSLLGMGLIALGTLYRKFRS